MLCDNIFYELSTCQLKYFVRNIGCVSDGVCVYEYRSEHPWYIRIRIVHGRTVLHRTFGLVCVLNRLKIVGSFGIFYLIWFGLVKCVSMIHGNEKENNKNDSSRKQQIAIEWLHLDDDYNDGRPNILFPPIHSKWSAFNKNIQSYKKNKNVFFFFGQMKNKSSSFVGVSFYSFFVAYFSTTSRNVRPNMQMWKFMKYVHIQMMPNLKCKWERR